MNIKKAEVLHQFCRSWKGVYEVRPLLEEFVGRYPQYSVSLGELACDLLMDDLRRLPWDEYIEVFLDLTEHNRKSD